MTVERCRRSVDAPCVEACPADALTVEARYENVRRVEQEKCIGCGSCVKACPYAPSRTVLAPHEEYGGELTSRKCDLCANAPYHWDEAGGGPGGKQACVTVCPVGAIAYTDKIPKQEGDRGYYVDLRDRNWGRLGYPSN